MNILKKLNLIPNNIYETIVTTYNAEDELPNAAPMGIKMLDDQNVEISPYLSAQTYKNIEKHRCAVINFIFDLNIFFESTFSTQKPKLSLTFYKKAKKIDAPQLKEAAAHIEISVSEIQKDKDRAKIKGKIIAWEVSNVPFVPINRGFGLVLESMIHATRIKIFQNDPQKVKVLKDLITKYKKIVEKVAPDNDLLSIMNRIHGLIN